MASQFRVSAEEARSAIREARDLQQAATDSDDESADVPLDAVAERIRAQGARRMGRHVTVIETSARLSDLVVPADLRTQLEEIVAWHRSSHRVRWSMELGVGDPLGVGLTCLMAGKSGTGKTFAARCLATELGLNLYRIDLSQVVSKYIGETEKALAQAFDEVEAGHGLLLFDEADALFGRRSEVKDAHDRYANIEVGYLLQRLESYDGIAVLTTNLQGNMDAAFVRRLRFILHFPSPDRELRRQLWERSLPGRAWRDDDLELDALADRFQLNGGAIHNVGLAAAHLAAATDSGRITSAHVVRATQRELQKTGRPSDAAAFGPLAEFMSGNGAHG
jgi:SpoVK/Ycf46/Vps4 family AAA+-type ATPase